MFHEILQHLAIVHPCSLPQLFLSVGHVEHHPVHSKFIVLCNEVFKYADNVRLLLVIFLRQFLCVSPYYAVHRLIMLFITSVSRHIFSDVASTLHTEVSISRQSSATFRTVQRLPFFHSFFLNGRRKVGSLLKSVVYARL